MRDEKQLGVFVTCDVRVFESSWLDHAFHSADMPGNECTGILTPHVVRNETSADAAVESHSMSSSASLSSCQKIGRNH